MNAALVFLLRVPCQHSQLQPQYEILQYRPHSCKAALDPLAHFNCDFTTTADDCTQERVGRGLLRVVLYRGIKMLEFIISKFFYHPL